tara:strand:+ start:83 stop:523 length:441 start_codon:yes stop_codon:yes gene_type:complete
MKVYLSGEIHTNWRDEIIDGSKGLNISFSTPVTNHSVSDDCGSHILGVENDKYWHDKKSAQINSIRIRSGIEQSDIIIVRFGEKFKQWNAAFDAGYAAALGKSLIIMHDPSLSHALKEVDAAALAVAEKPNQVVKILKYVITGELS